MANINREVDQKKITDLISEINQDNICLPDFQRDFVWKPEQMAKLIESVIRQYPIGTLMFLKADSNQTFGRRSFKGTNEEFFTPQYYVIDGQQRLNTFYTLIRQPEKFEPFDPFDYNGKNYKVFFNARTNIERLQSPDEEKTFIEAVRIEKDEKEDYKKQGKKDKKRRIPLEFILNEKYVNEWINIALEHVSENERETCKRNILNVKYYLERYECVIEKVENKLNAKDHYSMFQLLNEAGTDLTIFDLLVAKLNRIGVNLRKLWKESQENHYLLKSYDLDPVYILKTISLISGTKNDEKYPTCSKKDLINLHKNYSDNNGAREFEKDWKDACEYLNKALKDMKNYYGVCNKKYIPYSPMIITLASIKWWIDEIKEYDQVYKSSINKKIDRWYWGSIFNSAYDKRTDNVISSHYQALRSWIGPKGQSKIPRDINFKKNKNEIHKMLNDIESSADARYKAIICLPLRDSINAKDIYSNEFLQDSQLHDHHIYPRKFLEEAGIKERDKINNIVNRMLITDATNLTIKDNNPYDYLEIVEYNSLEKHFLFRTIVAKNLDYNEFCEKRRETICNYIYELLNY